jgi:hypothetical protein
MLPFPADLGRLILSFHKSNLLMRAVQPLRNGDGRNAPQATDD